MLMYEKTLNHALEVEGFNVEIEEISTSDL